MNDKVKGRIVDVIDDYHALPLECDGLTRVIHYLFKNARIAHKCFIGKVEWEDRSIPIHLWIETKTGYMVDYRCTYWLGDNPELPNGVFKMEDYPDVKYEGNQIDLKVSEPVYQMLTISRRNE